MIKLLLFRCLLLVIIAAVLSGCSFSRLHVDLEQLDAVDHVFAGTVFVKGFESNAIGFAALRDQRGSQIAASQVVLSSGQFEFRSTPQPLWLFVFIDLNNDFTFQENEPYGWGNDGQPVDPEIAPTDQLVIEISTVAGTMLPAPVDLIGVPLVENISDIVPLLNGEVISLDNPLFSQEQAKKGLWQPHAFMEDGTTGIKFLENYDSSRIPVLFVHGISDTPRRFAAMIEGLDHSKYQAWVYSYPSGYSLSLTANYMNKALDILHIVHKFDQLHIIAHSMGGLVSRGGLNICVQEHACDYLRSYTTISTPWNGVASARAGVERLPENVQVPVWHGLDPGSDYLSALFDTPLPEGVPYNLIFGFKQNSVFGSESSDGVINLSSQLRQAAQQQASLIRGYDEDHTSIVSNESVIALVNEILDTNSQ